MTKYIVFLCWLGALPGLVAAGEIYRYVDEQGRVHYTDEPPPQYERKAEALWGEYPQRPLLRSVAEVLQHS